MTQGFGVWQSSAFDESFGKIHVFITFRAKMGLQKVKLIVQSSPGESEESERAGRREEEKESCQPSRHSAVASSGVYFWSGRVCVARGRRPNMELLWKKDSILLFRRIAILNNTLPPHYYLLQLVANYFFNPPNHPLRCWRVRWEEKKGGPKCFSNCCPSSFSLRPLPSSSERKS